MTAPLILLLLSTLGAIDATYLTYTHLFGSGACAAGSGCGDVMASPYSKLFGIPLSTYGLGLYLAIAVAAWRGLRPSDRDASIRLAFLLASVGIIPTAFLIYLQAVVIEAWCPFCVVSAALMAVLLVVARRERSRLTPDGSLPFSRELIPVGLAMVLPSLLFVPLQNGLRAELENGLLTGTEVVAKIGDREITAAEIDRGIHLKSYEMRNGLRKEWLDRQVLEAAAAERGMEVREFVQKVIYSSIEITQVEIDQRYEKFKNRWAPGTTKASVTPFIRSDLGRLKSKSARDRYTKSLREKYGTTYSIPASERFAIDPNPRGGPEKGSPDAPVTIIEFSDLQCSYCARAHTQLTSMIERRGKDVRIIFRHLPLDMHKYARDAAEVAVCANDQGKFWPLADALFANQNQMEHDQILDAAEKAGIDREKLEACLATGEAERKVQADIDEADAIGITSTPSFFINGHYIGSMPQGGLDALVDQELRGK